MEKLNDKELNEVAGGGNAIYGVDGQIPTYDGIEGRIRDVDLVTEAGQGSDSNDTWAPG